MSYTVRIVQADGVERYLGRYLKAGHLFGNATAGTRYKTISNARRAAKKYIGDGKHLGTYHADILDDNDHERSIEI